MKFSASLRRTIGVLCIASIAGLAAWGWHFYYRPVILSAAVGPSTFDDAELIASMAQALATNGSHIRLSIQQPPPGPIESLERLKRGKRNSPSSEI
ncbi:hypothetical protein [Methylocella tundrae]|uniref:TRAP transporter solute receptor, TAXI family n=1 Tax=Methylocella tundrae TaxID=227605 RepID=A0A4U8Z6M5_METTU